MKRPISIHFPCEESLLERRERFRRAAEPLHLLKPTDARPGSACPSPYELMCSVPDPDSRRHKLPTLEASSASQAAVDGRV